MVNVSRHLFVQVCVSFECARVALLRVEVQKVLARHSRDKLWRNDSADRMSLSGIQDLLNSLCMVTVIKGKQDLCSRLRCSCQFASKAGRCAHMASVAYLQGLRSDAFKKMLQQTSEKGFPRRDVVQKLKVWRPNVSRAIIPDASAWKTCAQIAFEASERYRKTKLKARAGRDRSAVESTPAKERGKVLSREAMLQEIAKKFVMGSWEDEFAGMHMTLKYRVTSEEAHAQGIHKNVFHIAKNGQGGSLRNMADKMCAAWKLEEDNRVNVLRRRMMQKSEVKVEVKEEAKEEKKDLKRKSESSSYSESSTSFSSSSSEEPETVKRKLDF